ncbi:MAG TPA: AI-2E family transporter [Acetobacteraceae bacterium]|nr:AI-2E family transporter [Acetobacteraceae bacterium]
MAGPAIEAPNQRSVQEQEWKTGDGTALVADGRSSDERVEMPLPRHWNTIFLGGLFLLALLACLYVARDFVLPVVLAVMLKLLLQPVVRLLERIHVPRGLGALAAVLLVLAVLGGLGSILSGPAAAWAKQLPQEWPKLQEHLASVSGAVRRLQGLAGHIGVHIGGSGGALPFQPSSIVTVVLGGTGAVAARLLETLVILYYLLVFGETFLRRTVEILPRFQDKREAVELSLHVERDLSAYLVTITAINAVVGCAAALVMWVCGVPGPPLWGVAAFCLNFIPYLGPFFGVLLFLVVGGIVKGLTWVALLPAGLYLAIHVAEGEVITPLLLARRFTINPVAVMLSLTFWFWMWGVPGAVLAVPVLAVIKIVSDRLRPLRAFGHLLEG